MSKTLTHADLATIELAFRAVPKPERKDEANPAVAARTHVPTEIRSLKGEELRSLAGPLAAGITTQVEARAKANAERKAERQANPNLPERVKQASARTENARRSPSGVSQADAIRLTIELKRAAGWPITRADAKAAKVGFYATKA